MASSLRRLARERFAVPLDKTHREFRRADDPELAIDVACIKERNNIVAVRHGLPAIGSTLVNKYGIEWVVDGHVYASDAHSLHAWRDGKGEQPENLYPSINPQNFSDKLTEFAAAVARCTTKCLMLLDTMPGVRGGTAIPGGNSIDTIANPGAILVFLDAARVHETVIAHEIGHAWVQYVEECEDHRVMKDASDPQRIHQLTFVQSFVLDLKVNDLIRTKGFDLTPIEEDQAQSIVSLGQAIDAGFKPEHIRQEVFLALTLAAQILNENRGIGTGLAPLDNTLAKVSSLAPALAKLAQDFADAVRTNGYADHAQVIASIDECFHLAFDHTGDGIDLENDLIIPNIPEPDFDKYPKWLEGAPVALKCEVGRIMAREDVPAASLFGWSDAGGSTALTFELPDGSKKGPFLLAHHFPLERFEDSRRIQEINRMNRERAMNNAPQPPTPGGPKLPNIPGAQSPVPGWPQPPGFRPYMAGYGRWVTQAALDMQLAGEQPYAYANCNPVTYTDPLGLSPGGPVDVMGGHTGPCKVLVCSVYGWEGGIGGLVPTHKFICVQGPHGGCQGGLYPNPDNTSGWGGGHVESDHLYPCGGRNSAGILVKCETFSTDCGLAANVCGCLKKFANSPPNYNFPVQTCYQFPWKVINCACDEQPTIEAKLNCWLKASGGPPMIVA
ncbi:MAG: hypothetical protein ACYC96_10885 [Fimbriimonadaceae bacterium]